MQSENLSDEGEETATVRREVIAKRGFATGRGLARAAVLLLTLAILFVCGLTFFAQFRPAQAACGGNTNVGSEAALTSAILNFNGQSGPCVYTMTLTADINLTGPPPPIENSSTNVELIIEGAGFTVDGGSGPGLLRPFVIGPNTNVTMNELTVTGGYAPETGGAILNSGSLTITDSILSSNTISPTSSGASGGAIANFGSLTITGSTFSGNSVPGSSTDALGGAIANSGVLTITGSIFSNNTTAPASQGAGGAIFNEGSLTIDSTTFDGNTAPADFSLGGAIFNSVDAHIAITNSTFSDNSANFGGAITLHNTAPITISNSTFSGNSAVDQGGAISNENSAMTLLNDTFSGNSAGDSGGAIASGFIFCFTADMHVQMADGSSKRIADIKVGDQVLSYDFAQGRQVVATVQHILQRSVGAYYRLNGVEVTAEHPFAVGNDEWRAAKELQIGDRVLTAEGWTTITSKSLVKEEVEVYNLSVDGPHNYYVATSDDDGSRYLVHNKNIAISDGQTLMQNTIITNSTGGDCFASGSGAFLGSNNLIDDHDSGACADISDAAVTNFDDELRDNGGPTLTHALFSNSNALDTGDNDLALAPDGSTLTTDQRGAGFPRILNDIVDIGAYEGFIERDEALLMTAAGPGTTGDGVSFGKEDILLWDGSNWSKFFDGTSVGLTTKHDIDAIHVNGEDDLYLSFFQNKIKTADLGNVLGTDILHYDGSGFSLYFDGSDVGLNKVAQEKIDALHILDGSLWPFAGDCAAYLLISTFGTGKVPNFGGGTINFQGEDILGFCATNTGAATSGFWTLVLDGSAEGMPKNSTDSISASEDGETIFLTTKGTFDVDDAFGGHSMVYVYDTINDEFNGPIFSAPANGLNEKVDGLHVEGDLP